MLTKKLINLWLCGFLFLSCLAHAEGTHWASIAKGVAYTKISASSSESSGIVHAFLIDPRYYRFQLRLASQVHETALFAGDISKDKNVVLAINGGFFTPDFKPIGLRISESKELSAFKNISWLGIFMIRNNRPSIISANAYRNSSSIDMAIQAGPRLVIHGYVPKLSGAPAERSALGITASGQVVVVITDRLLLTTTELAQLMQNPASKGGLGCVDAINLDGGSSSQIYTKFGNFHLHISSMRPVSDLVVVLSTESL